MDPSQTLHGSHIELAYQGHMILRVFAGGTLTPSYKITREITHEIVQTRAKYIGG